MDIAKREFREGKDDSNSARTAVRIAASACQALIHVPAAIDTKLVWPTRDATGAFL